MINFYYIKKFKVTKKGKVTAVKAGKAKVTVTEKLKKKKRCSDQRESPSCVV